jgi:hypothetical protein
MVLWKSSDLRGHFFANPLAMLVQQRIPGAHHILSAGLSTGCVDNIGLDRPA